MTLLTLLAWRGASPPAAPPSGGALLGRMRRRMRQVLHLPAIRTRHQHRIGALVSIRFRLVTVPLMRLAVAIARVPVVRQVIAKPRHVSESITAQPAALVRFPAARIGGRVRLGGPPPLTDDEIIAAVRALEQYRAR